MVQLGESVGDGDGHVPVVRAAAGSDRDPVDVVDLESAASDPGRDGDSAFRQRFLCDSASCRDGGAPAGRPRVAGCADAG